MIVPFNMKKVIKKENMVTPKKTTKRTKKNEPILDLTMAEDSVDVFAAYGFAKVNAGMPISEIELKAIVDNYIDAMLASMFTWNNTIMLNDDGAYIAMNLSVYKPEDQEDKSEPKNDEPVKIMKKPGFFKRFWNWLRGKK